MRAAVGTALLMVSMIAFGLISNESDLQFESRFSEPSYEPMSCSSSTSGATGSDEASDCA